MKITPIQTPQVGQPPLASWGTAVANQLNAMRITGDGKNIFVSQSPNGVSIRYKDNVKKTKGGGEVVASGVPCKITGGNSLTGYNVDTYANGRFKPKTGTGILHLLEVAAMSNLPVGSWVVGWNVQQALTGGND